MSNKKLVSEREMDVPAAKIWKIVTDDFGDVSKWHPEIVSSKITSEDSSIKSGLERFCDYSMNGKRWAKERLEDYDPENMSFTLNMLEVKDIPMDPEHCHAKYKVEDLGNGRSKLIVESHIRTKPAMLATFFVPFLKGAMKDMFLGISHHASTGERVDSYVIKRLKKEGKS